ncbi:YqiA/YcfP family alpha/beta fold hydrolase [Uliginosibacterium sp. sgz301328]|uniref:YqiA/YcfP family alpha/beta fold hydrolase n=1 Tax=Uliginosibacterium sp. sgz301328 TaxID=3243764 RepID=UPI00359EDA48
MLIYLHGFRSGPQSHKSQSLRAHMAAQGLADAFWGEQLALVPRDAIAQVSRVIEACAVAPTLVGSSLGGHYATALAERYGLKAVLVNPSVISHVTLEPFLGRQTMIYTGEEFDVRREHLDQMRELDVERLADPARYWLMVEQGDELLDYRLAVQRYTGARQTVLEGGDHSFTRWDEYLDDILRFAGLLPEARP